MEEMSSARRQPRQERARARVDGILDASVEVLRTEGLSGFTMSAIAAHAGTSVPSLYRYFADREAIIAALAERYFDSLHTLMDQELTGLRTGGQARQALADLLTSYYEAFRSDPALALLWGGAVADVRLAELNTADSRRNGTLLAQRIGPFSPLPDDLLLRRCTLASHLTLATVCFALSLDPQEGAIYVAEFGSWADAILFGGEGVRPPSM